MPIPPRMLVRRSGRWWPPVGLWLALLLAACGNAGPDLPALAPDAVILAFGDSLTRGTGAATDASYPAQLQRLSGRTVRKLDPQALRDNLIAMIEAARSRQVAVLLVGIPRPGIFLSTAEVYGEVAQATGVALEDSAFAEVLDRRELKADTVHPNGQGYREVAGRIQQRLVELGALRP